jgi:hypothetical protein
MNDQYHKIDSSIHDLIMMPTSGRTHMADFNLCYLHSFTEIAFYYTLQNNDASHIGGIIIKEVTKGYYVAWYWYLLSLVLVIIISVATD